MEIPAEIKAAIAELRSQHAELAALSDEQILMMVQQAQTQAGQAPAAGGALPDLESMSANKCGVLGEQLLHAGRWDEAERCFFAGLEKAEKVGDLDGQCKAAIAHY